MGTVFQVHSPTEDEALHHLEMHCLTLVLARVIFFFFFGIDNTYICLTGSYEAWTLQSLVMSGVQHDINTDTNMTSIPVFELSLMCLTNVHMSVSCSMVCVSIGVDTS